MLAPSMAFIILADLIFALGYAVKQITESSFLFENLKKKERINEYNKIEGKGIAVYYYIETITSILAGFLFVINPYIPFILGTIMSFIAVCIAIQFKELKNEPKIECHSFKEQIKNLEEGIKSTLKSKRLKALILYAAIFTGIVEINLIYYVNFFKNLGVNVEQFTLVFSILAIIQGIASQNQYLIERKTKKKTLTYLAMLFTLSLIIIGVFGTSLMPVAAIIGLTIGIVIVQRIITGTYEVSMSRYMVNFTTKEIAPNILATYNFFKNIGESFLLFLGALLISKIDINNAYLIFGVSSFIVMLLIVNYMKNKVGIKPKEEIIDYI